MTFGKINALSVVAGVVFGVALFSLVYGFRDAFVAASEVSIVAGNWRAALIVIVPGIAVGWGLAVLAPRLTDECGGRLLIPLLLFVGAGVGTSVVLEQQFAQAMLKALAVRSMLAGVVIAVTATVVGWINT